MRRLSRRAVTAHVWALFVPARPAPKWTTLLAEQIAGKDPSLSPKLVHKAAAAIGDVANIAAKLGPQQLVQLGAYGRLLATSIAQIAASSAASRPPGVDSIVGTVKGGGTVGAATLSLLIAGLPKVLHMCTDFGRTLNSVDKFKIVALARQIAIIAGQAGPGASARQSEESRLQVRWTPASGTNPLRRRGVSFRWAGLATERTGQPT
ncbi:hypothetical protein ACFPA8_03825 [Streptomyces ovatisporus]|uniref:Uncharacterized protein n=1 Tax=Streptomyces ovatisporus TaxID=1128682 RepID=A0ABV9A1D2_9ACTN